MSTDHLFYFGVGLGVTGFTLAGRLWFGPGLLDRLEAARRKRADRGMVTLR